MTTHDTNKGETDKGGNLEQVLTPEKISPKN
jgi:hypothetical protein